VKVKLWKKGNRGQLDSKQSLLLLLHPPAQWHSFLSSSLTFPTTMLLLLLLVHQDGVHLCTFPEGTRSKSGRLGTFKNGAFKMAHKVGAPVIPVSIVGAAKAMPYYWMFPFRPAAGICKVIVHEPVESIDKTEEELAEAVREAIISGLPEDQKPLTHLKSANESEESSS
jgi:1-acyl-sn-glycerol-3-phosphate acyltransferase